MKKFEYYKHYHESDILTWELDKLGDQGWELCACEIVYETSRFYYFKREIVEPKETPFKQIKCFSQQTLCYSDFKNEDKIFTINVDKIAYKSGIEIFTLPLSDNKTSETYFFIQLINGFRLFCRESEFNKI